jgi:hypothetical protein
MSSWEVCPVQKPQAELYDTCIRHLWQNHPEYSSGAFLPFIHPSYKPLKEIP